MQARRNVGVYYTNFAPTIPILNLLFLRASKTAIKIKDSEGFSCPLVAKKSSCSGVLLTTAL